MPSDVIADYSAVHPSSGEWRKNGSGRDHPFVTHCVLLVSLFAHSRDIRGRSSHWQVSVNVKYNLHSNSYDIAKIYIKAENNFFIVAK